MSPSEFDLRAALHDGEGDPVDAGAVIAAGQARIARRRTHLRNGAVTAALLAALVGGGIAVFSGGSDRKTAGGNGGGTVDTRGADAKAGGGAAGGAGGATAPRPSSSPAVPGPAAAAPSATCSASAPQAPSARSADPSAPMFAKPVSSIVVCAYSQGNQTGRPRASVLTGAQAREFAASLENASKTRPSGMCPDYISADERRLAVRASTADGTPLQVVVTTINAAPCRVVATNGTAVRYAWSPPVDLGPVLRQLVGPQQEVPKQGSPARS
jgi:hypothetical protein